MINQIESEYCIPVIGCRKTVLWYNGKYDGHLARKIHIKRASICCVFHKFYLVNTNIKRKCNLCLSHVHIFIITSWSRETDRSINNQAGTKKAYIFVVNFYFKIIIWDWFCIYRCVYSQSYILIRFQNQTLFNSYLVYRYQCDSTHIHTGVRTLHRKHFESTIASNIDPTFP